MKAPVIFFHSSLRLTSMFPICTLPPSAMLHQPQVLVLDEPFNFLDPSSQSIIKHLLKAYNEETGATILVSSHNLNHTVDICPRIALLENGKIIRDIDNKGNSAEKELEDYFNVTE